MSTAVSISYSELQANPSVLRPAIERAFGSHPASLGIILVRDLPPAFPALRATLLRLAHSFAALPQPLRDHYVHPASHYSFGWSHGKEIMNGKPDTLKASYYANPTVDNPSVDDALRTQYPEYYSDNIWPDESAVDGFEQAFKDLGRFIFKVGCELAQACQPFVASHLSDASVSLHDLIATSQTTKARLLHYFPPTDPSQLASKDEPVDSWCGFHLDHSLLTGLCSALYLDHKNITDAGPAIVSSPSEASGLYIRTRGGDLTKVTIPPDCLAFQTGEALELATGGKLRATPHCVRVGGDGMDGVSRETFALFMQPDVHQQVSPTENFGQFSKRIIREHYEGTI